MGEKANRIFPFVLAFVLPPAGVILGLLYVQQGDPELGWRLVGAAVLGAILWVLLFVV